MIPEKKYSFTDDLFFSAGNYYHSDVNERHDQPCTGAQADLGFISPHTYDKYLCLEFI